MKKKGPAKSTRVRHSPTLSSAIKGCNVAISGEGSETLIIMVALQPLSCDAVPRNDVVVDIALGRSYIRRYSSGRE